jgi:hypothetical protein
MPPAGGGSRVTIGRAGGAALRACSRHCPIPAQSHAVLSARAKKMSADATEEERLHVRARACDAQSCSRSGPGSTDPRKPRTRRGFPTSASHATSPRNGSASPRSLTICSRKHSSSLRTNGNQRQRATRRRWPALVCSSSGGPMHPRDLAGASDRWGRGITRFGGPRPPAGVGPMRHFSGRGADRAGPRQAASGTQALASR